MTRARRIEAAIAEWMERDGWIVREGEANKDIAYMGTWVSDDLSVTSLAEHIDAEFERIFAEELDRRVKAETARLQDELMDAQIDADFNREFERGTDHG